MEPDPDYTHIVIGDKFSDAGVELIEYLKDEEKEELINDFNLYCEDVGVTPSGCPEEELNKFLSLLSSTVCLSESSLYVTKSVLAKLNKQNMQ